MSDKIIVLSCVHGRSKTVKKCLELSPEVERVFVYSNDSDGNTLSNYKAFKYPNQPLSKKWNYGIEVLEHMDFDAVILLGSDDYFDENYLNFVKENWSKYDMIGFTDMYFEDIAGKKFYWGGYKNNRVGEPAGAGKVYSKKFLERINYNLFPVDSDRGLDGQSWVVVNFSNANMLITSLRENGLMVCDVKDGEGITPLHNIRGLVRV